MPLTYYILVYVWYHLLLQAELGREIRAILCACKPLAGFVARDGIQECREACGGHGYLAGGNLFTLGGHYCHWVGQLCSHLVP